MMHLTLLATSLFAIIGGPSVGKTSIIKALAEEGEITCREAATDIILDEQALGHASPWEEFGFEIKIFDEKVKREDLARKKAKDQGKLSIFTDRGLLDSLVYIEILNKHNSVEAKYIQEKLTELNPSSRYKALFFVEPHTSTGFELAKCDIRRENTSEALLIAQKIKEIYAKTGLPIITVPSDLTPKERALFVLQKAKELS